LLEVTSITPSKIQEFDEVVGKIKALWQLQKSTEANMELMRDLATKYPATPNPNISISKISISRAEIENSKFPPDFLISVFQTKIAGTTPVFKSNNRSYFAYIRSVKIDKTLAGNIKKTSAQDIAETIRDAMIEELINHIIRVNGMKINMKTL
jgi:hypothetical protein